MVILMVLVSSEVVACGGRNDRQKTLGHVAGAAVIAAVVASPFT